MNCAGVFWSRCPPSIYSDAWWVTLLEEAAALPWADPSQHAPHVQQGGSPRTLSPFSSLPGEEMVVTGGSTLQALLPFSAGSLRSTRASPLCCFASSEHHWASPAEQHYSPIIPCSSASFCQQDEQDPDNFPICFKGKIKNCRGASHEVCSKLLQENVNVCSLQNADNLWWWWFFMIWARKRTQSVSSLQTFFIYRYPG